MNAYDQLHAIRERLERQGALPETLTLIDRFIAQAEPQQDSPLSISQTMILRHLLSQRQVLDNEAIYMNLLAIMEDERLSRDDEDRAPRAQTEADRAPQHLHGYYKKQKEKERERQGHS